MSEIRRVRAADAQTLFWMQQMRAPDRRSANITSLIRLRGAFDHDRFRAAVAAVVQRHEIFRTAFDWGSGELEQIIHDEVEPPVTTIQIPEETPSDELLSGLTMHQFAHDEAPLLRITIAETPRGVRYVHVLAHHSIYDLHTQELFRSDLERAYRGETLQPVAAHYADFALAELSWKESDAATRQREFWRSRTEAFPELPQMATRSTEAPGSVYVELGPDLSARVREFCAANRTASFLVLAAAYEMALSRWFRVSDFGLGVPFTNRRQPEVGEVAGCCMNILPLRATIDPADSFTRVLASFRRQMLVGHRNQELPILETMSLAGRPLYRFGFTADAPLDLKLDGCESDPVDCPRPGALALFYHVEEDVDRGVVRIRADYNGHDLGRDAARRFGDYYLALLSQTLQNPDREIVAFESPAHHSAARLVGPALPAIPSHVLHLINSSIESNPDDDAVLSADDDRLSYADLSRLVSCIAGNLAAAGVAAGDRVALSLDRCARTPATILALWTLGAAYVPVDPNLPPTKAESIIRAAECRYLVSSPDSRAVSAVAQIVRLDVHSLAAGWRDVIAAPLVVPESTGVDLAYVMFTSGSTGSPKGVMVTHANLANFIASIIETIPLTASDRLLAITTCSFDISLLELFAPLATGASLYVANARELSDPNTIASLCSRHSITTVQATPATWEILTAPDVSFPVLEKILCGGEALPRDLATRLTKLGARVWNLYGPTETTVWSSAILISDLRLDAPIPIGNPLHNQVVSIRDAAGTEVQSGLTGEICIGGAGVTAGYYGNDELTLQRFFDCDGLRWYRTGDLGKIEDGVLHYLGRSDFELKIRGFRVDPAEVEQVVEAYPGVSRAVVAGWKRDSNLVDSVLVSYYTVIEAGTVDTADLKRFCADRLAPYALPQMFFELTAFPMTANFKVDRKRLPDPGSLRTPVESGPDESSDDSGIAALFGELLGTGPVDPDTPFFDLGVTSLLVHRIVVEMERRLGLDITVTDFFSCANVNELAAFCANGNPRAADDDSDIDRAELRRQALARRRRGRS